MSRRRDGGRQGKGAGGRLTGRWLLLVPALLILFSAAPATAQVLRVELSVSPQFPTVVTVGQAGLPAKLSMVNSATVGGVPVAITEITLNPSCGSVSLDCSAPDPGVFALSPTATGTSGACLGRTFTVTPPDANGRSVFVPNAPFDLQPPGQADSTCDISFTFRVLKAPTLDAQPSAGLQTAAVATVTGSAKLDPNVSGVGVARGLQTVNVGKAQPTVVTTAIGAQAVGGTIVDTAAVSGPVALGGTVTFRLYGPNDPGCTGPAIFSSTNPLSGGSSTSDPFTTTAVGTYRFVATYSGDANDNSVTGNCADPGEAVVVGPPGGGRYTPLTPARVLDTRDGTGLTGPVGPGSTVDVQIAGKGGVPATGVSAVALNVTVTQPTALGYVTLFPTGAPRPEASNLDFFPGDTVPNLVVVKLGTGGRASVFNATGTTHLVADVAGWFSDTGTGNDGRFQPLVPARILDTRVGTGGGARLGPGGSLDVQVAGQGGVPATGVEAAVLNVTVTGTTATSFLTAYPTGEARPLASNLNFDSGDTVANRVFAKLGAGGKVTIFNLAGSADVVVDVGGWYTDASLAGVGGTYTPLNPARILDTRTGAGGVTGPLAGGTSVDVQVTGQAGVPSSGVRAVVLNATVVQPAALGYLTMFPAGAPLPNASDLDFAPGDIRANLVVVGVGTGGRVGLFTLAGTHVVLDVAGWFS
jgi:hypothetical protein